MTKKLFNASLVGIQFCKPPFNIYLAIKNSIPILKREPTNHFDKSAVEVLISGHKIGYINKECAAEISLLLEMGMDYIISLREFSDGAKSIGLGIEFSLSTNIPTAPTVTPKNTGGIYKISILGDENIYIGQSNDVNSRLSSHWKNLSFNTHHNKVMQHLWNLHGHLSFTADIIELLNNEFSSLDKQRWLAEKEKYWIKIYRDKGNCINITDGEIIPTKKSVEEYEIESKKEIKQFDAEVREKKKLLKAEIILAEKLHSDNHKILEMWRFKTKELDDLVRKNTGIRGFLFGNPGDIVMVKYKKLELDKAIEQLRHYEKLSSDLWNKVYELKNQYRKLKTYKQLEGLANNLLIGHGINPNKNNPKIK